MSNQNSSHSPNRFVTATLRPCGIEPGSCFVILFNACEFHISTDEPGTVLEFCKYLETYTRNTDKKVEASVP